MTETLCTSGSVKLKAGKYFSSDLTAADFTTLINQAESAISSESRINFVDIYSSLDNDTKKILEDAASSHAAISVIGYDPLGFQSLAAAQFTTNVNYTRFKEAMNLLKDKKVTDFLGAE